MAEQKQQTVAVVASGYEWICPKCEHLNRMAGYRSDVECEKCCEEFAADLPHHAYD